MLNSQPMGFYAPAQILRDALQNGGLLAAEPVGQGAPVAASAEGDPHP